MLRKANFFSVAILSLWLSGFCYADIITVGDPCTVDYDKIQDAINATVDGDTTGNLAGSSVVNITNVSQTVIVQVFHSAGANRDFTGSINLTRIGNSV